MSAHVSSCVLGCGLARLPSVLGSQCQVRHFRWEGAAGTVTLFVSQPLCYKASADLPVESPLATVKKATLCSEGKADVP
jgi:hypothetical protein